MKFSRDGEPSTGRPSSFVLLPSLHFSPRTPTGQIHRKSLSVKPAWQVPLFQHGRFLHRFCLDKDNRELLVWGVLVFSRTYLIHQWNYGHEMDMEECS